MKQYDEIGIWSELKLSIIRDYATEYSKILSNQSGLRHMYIDGFADPEFIFRSAPASSCQEAR